MTKLPNNVNVIIDIKHTFKDVSKEAKSLVLLIKEMTKLPNNI